MDAVDGDHGPLGGHLARTTFKRTMAGPAVALFGLVSGGCPFYVLGTSMVRDHPTGWRLWLVCCTAVFASLSIGVSVFPDDPHFRAFWCMRNSSLALISFSPTWQTWWAVESMSKRVGVRTVIRGVQLSLRAPIFTLF